MKLIDMEIACFYVKMKVWFWNDCIILEYECGVKDTWLAMDGGVPHPGYCWILEFVLSDHGLGVAHPFVFGSHGGATCCGHHVCPCRFGILGWTSMLNVICEMFLLVLGILTRPFGLTHVFENLKSFQGSWIARLRWSLSKRVELIASEEDYVRSSGPLLDSFILSCKGVFTRFCVRYMYCTTWDQFLAFSYLNVNFWKFGLL
jgi:hypothetical protein